MLKEASVALASRTSTLSSVARSKRSLSSLDAALSTFTGTHHQLQLDWSQPREFTDSIAAHINRVGPPSLVLAWLHDDDIGREVARCCGSETSSCQFFQVRGSTAASPHGNAAVFAEQFKALPGIHFHQVILGFQRTPTGSRWLTNAEIVSGTLRAVDEALPISIVGVVEPWSEAP